MYKYIDYIIIILLIYIYILLMKVHAYAIQWSQEYYRLAWEGFGGAETGHDFRCLEIISMDSWHSWHERYCNKVVS